MTILKETEHCIFLMNEDENNPYLYLKISAKVAELLNSYSDVELYGITQEGSEYLLQTTKDLREHIESGYVVYISGDVIPVDELSAKMVSEKHAKN